MRGDSFAVKLCAWDSIQHPGSQLQEMAMCEFAERKAGDVLINNPKPKTSKHPKIKTPMLRPTSQELCFSPDPGVGVKGWTLTRFQVTCALAENLCFGVKIRWWILESPRR